MNGRTKFCVTPVNTTIDISLKAKNVNHKRRSYERRPDGLTLDIAGLSKKLSNW